MRHSGNVASRIDQTYGGEGVTLKVYVHDELGRFVTVASLSLGLKEVEAMVSGITQRRAELDTLPLFELDPGEGGGNVRWLPPKP